MGTNMASFPTKALIVLLILLDTRKALSAPTLSQWPAETLGPDFPTAFTYPDPNLPTRDDIEGQTSPKISNVDVQGLETEDYDNKDRSPKSMLNTPDLTPLNSERPHKRAEHNIPSNPSPEELEREILAFLDSYNDDSVPMGSSTTLSDEETLATLSPEEIDQEINSFLDNYGTDRYHKENNTKPVSDETFGIQTPDSNSIGNEIKDRINENKKQGQDIYSIVEILIPALPSTKLPNRPTEDSSLKSHNRNRVDTSLARLSVETKDEKQFEENIPSMQTTISPETYGKVGRTVLNSIDPQVVLIIGGVAAGLLVILLLVVLFFVYVRYPLFRCKKNKKLKALHLNADFNRWDPQLLRPSQKSIDKFIFGTPLPSINEMITKDHSQV